MPKPWRTNEDTVAALVDSSTLSGIRKSVTVGPTEAVVVLRNGEMDEIVVEGQIKTRGFGDALLALVGAGPEIKVLIVDTSPFKLTYWLDHPGVVRKRDNEISLDLPAITKDGEPVSAQVNITFMVDAGVAHLLLRIMHGSDSIDRETIGRELRDEFLAKTLTMEVSKYDSSELRGNDELLKQIWNEAKVQLGSTFRGYGLNLNNSFINFGLTVDEQENIDRRRRDEEIKEAEHEKTIQQIRQSGAPQISNLVAGDGKVTVTWTPPMDNGGSEITNYTVKALSGGVSVEVNAPTTSVEVTGLTNGTSYTFTVTATNKKGGTSSSAPSISITPRTNGENNVLKNTLLMIAVVVVFIGILMMIQNGWRF